jgi:hypothetical protein
MNNLRRELTAMRHVCSCALMVAFLGVGVAHADGLRPAVATPLQAAEHALAAKQFGAALKDVQKAEAAPDKTVNETLTIDRVRAAIDASRQDYAAAAADYAAIIATGSLAPGELHTMAQAEASSDYQAGNYAGAIATIRTYLAGDPQFQTLLLQSYLKTGACDELAKAVAKLAKPPPENDLQMVAYCDATAKNTDAYAKAMAMLVKYDPSPAYWSELLGVAQENPAFSDQLALDFFRLKLATGVAVTEAEYMEMTQAALQAGLANEAASIITSGYASGVLGKGADADRQTRLKALVVKRQAAASANVASQIKAATAAQDELTLFGIGFNEVDGGNAAGLQLMADAIRSGKLSKPGQAELELGIAYREAGQEPNAKAMWNGVQGGDGAADLAMLWLYLH